MRALSPGATFSAAHGLVSLVLAVIGLVLGIAVASALLSYDGTRPVSVSWYLFILVFLQFVLVLSVVGAWILRRARGGGGAAESGVLLHLIRPFLTKVAGWLQGVRIGHAAAEIQDQARARQGVLKSQYALYGPVAILPLLIPAQIFGVAFNVGIILTTLMLEWFTDIAFGWGSTINVHPQTIHDITRLIALPWAWLFGEGIGYPTLEQVAGSRIILEQWASVTPTIKPDPTHLRSWSSFLVLAVVTYGLLPRLLLWGGSVLARDLILARLTFTHSRPQALYARMLAPRLETSVDGTRRGTEMPIPGTAQRVPRTGATPTSARPWRNALVRRTEPEVGEAPEAQIEPVAPLARHEPEPPLSEPLSEPSRPETPAAFELERDLNPFEPTTEVMPHHPTPPAPVVPPKLPPRHPERDTRPPPGPAPIKTPAPIPAEPPPAVSPPTGVEPKSEREPQPSVEPAPISGVEDVSLVEPEPRVETETTRAPEAPSPAVIEPVPTREPVPPVAPETVPEPPEAERAPPAREAEPEPMAPTRMVEPTREPAPVPESAAPVVAPTPLQEVGPEAESRPEMPEPEVEAPPAPRPPPTAREAEPPPAVPAPRAETKPAPKAETPPPIAPEPKPPRQTAPVAPEPPSPTRRRGPRFAVDACLLLLHVDIDDVLEDEDRPRLEQLLLQLTGWRVATMATFGAGSAMTEEVLSILEQGDWQAPPARVVVIEDGSQPPITESLRFLRELRATAGTRAQITLALVGDPSDDDRLPPVRAFDFTDWQRKIDQMADPYLRLEMLAPASEDGDD